MTARQWEQKEAYERLVFTLEVFIFFLFSMVFNLWFMTTKFGTIDIQMLMVSTNLVMIQTMIFLVIYTGYQTRKTQDLLQVLKTMAIYGDDLLTVAGPGLDWLHNLRKKFDWKASSAKAEQEHKDKAKRKKAEKPWHQNAWESLFGPPEDTPEKDAKAEEQDRKEADAAQVLHNLKEQAEQTNWPTEETDIEGILRQATDPPTEWEGDLSTGFTPRAREGHWEKIGAGQIWVDKEGS